MQPIHTRASASSSTSSACTQVPFLALGDQGKSRHCCTLRDCWYLHLRTLPSIPCLKLAEPHLDLPCAQKLGPSPVFPSTTAHVTAVQLSASRRSPLLRPPLSFYSLACCSFSPWPHSALNLPAALRVAAAHGPPRRPAARQCFFISGDLPPAFIVSLLLVSFFYFLLLLLLSPSPPRDGWQHLTS